VTPADTRRHPRLEFDGRAWCEHRNLTLYLPVANVSAGGIFLQTGASLSAGEHMKVSLGAVGTSSEEIVAKVEVVWTGKGPRGPGVGCRFTGFVSGEHAYNELIERLSS
jgi:Tfp pilus assembly protein PilZ